jgi:hypothetical protein
LLDGIRDLTEIETESLGLGFEAERGVEPMGPVT